MYASRACLWTCGGRSANSFRNRLVVREVTGGIKWLGLAVGELAEGFIRQLGERHTVLVSSHILSEVEMTCDRAVIIVGGRVAAQGKLADMVPAGGRLEEFFLRLVEGTAAQPVGA